MNVIKMTSMVIFLFMFMAGGVYAQKTGDKLGYVDLSRLFDEYYKTKDYDQKLETKHAEYEKESKAKIEKIRESQGKLALLKEDKRAKLRIINEIFL